MNLIEDYATNNHYFSIVAIQSQSLIWYDINMSWRMIITNNHILQSISNPQANKQSRQTSKIFQRLTGSERASRLMLSISHWFWIMKPAIIMKNTVTWLRVIQNVDYSWFDFLFISFHQLLSVSNSCIDQGQMRYRWWACMWKFRLCQFNRLAISKPEYGLDFEWRETCSCFKKQKMIEILS